MNSYQVRMSEKQARLMTRANKLAIQAQVLNDTANRLADVIPFGQPILVGHHSEGRDRRYRTRITSTFEKGFKIHQAAQHAASRAENYGSSNAIASDNPEAIQLLEEKIKKLEDVQTQMKKANAIIRKGKDVEAKLKEIGVPFEKTKPDFCGRVGFARFELTNNNAKIQQAKKRVEELKRLETEVVSKPIEHEEFTIEQDQEEGRIMVTFSGGKPSDEVRTIMKKNGYNWSPSRTAWVRKLTLNGICAMNHDLIPALKKSFEVKAV